MWVVGCIKYGYPYTGHTLSLHESMRNLTTDVNVFRAQVQVLGPKEIIRFKQTYGLRDHMSILDVGCGPGFMSEMILKEFPNSRITCIDIDEELLAFNIKEHHDLIISDRLTIYKRSANDTGLPSNSFDFALARLLFQVCIVLFINPLIGISTWKHQIWLIVCAVK